MKIQHILLNRYKRFVRHPIEDLPDVTLLVGDNGVGKTSILQAIAVTLGTATRQIREPLDLNWPGFVVDGLSANHRGFSKIELQVIFSESELEATQRFYDLSDYSTLPNAVRPGAKTELTLVWDQNPDATYPVSTQPIGTPYFYQFQGRRYAYNLLYNRNAQERMFEKIGGVFWYNEQRTSYSLAPFSQEGSDKNGKLPVKQIDDEDSMRRLITRWFASGNDKVERFNSYYQYLFPGRRLLRIAETYGAADSPIFFYDGRYEYDISELSAGERALMPLLLDFVEWGIHNSVILIDELELHLHPPLQQSLLALLPELGLNNQFIVTTHSDAIANLVEPNAIKRVNL